VIITASGPDRNSAGQNCGRDSRHAQDSRKSNLAGQSRGRDSRHAQSQERIKRIPVLGGLINEYERAAKKPRSGLVAEFRNPKPRFDVEDLAWLLRRYRLDPRDLTDLFGGALVVDFGEIGGDEAAVVRFTLCG
jgi:hypothetical protein